MIHVNDAQRVVIFRLQAQITAETYSHPDPDIPLGKLGVVHFHHDFVIKTLFPEGALQPRPENGVMSIQNQRPFGDIGNVTGWWCNNSCPGGVSIMVLEVKSSTISRAGSGTL